MNFIRLMFLFFIQQIFMKYLLLVSIYSRLWGYRNEQNKEGEVYILVLN